MGFITWIFYNAFLNGACFIFQILWCLNFLFQHWKSAQYCRHIHLYLLLLQSKRKKISTFNTLFCCLLFSTSIYLNSFFVLLKHWIWHPWYKIWKCFFLFLFFNSYNDQTMLGLLNNMCTFSFSIIRMRISQYDYTNKAENRNEHKRIE